MRERGDTRPASRLLEDEPETCCVCGGKSEHGLYVRADPEFMRCGGVHEDDAVEVVM